MVVVHYILRRARTLERLGPEYDDQEGQPETSSKYQRTIQMTSGVIKRGWKIPNQLAVFIGKNLKAVRELLPSRVMTLAACELENL
jgi:hypothetical protein